MRTVLLLAVAAPLFLAAIPANAGERTIAASIAKGEFAQAEKAIQTELRIHPGRPELLLNLAAVYAKTGREAQARALYAQVLAQRDVLMDMPNQKVVGSHRIATAALKRTETVRFTSR